MTNSGETIKSLVVDPPTGSKAGSLNLVEAFLVAWNAFSVGGVTGMAHAIVVTLLGLQGPLASVGVSVLATLVTAVVEAVRRYMQESPPKDKPQSPVSTATTNS